MIEILAPAGNMESLTAALRCGANAIYTGGKNFSARQNANNLDFDEMRTAIDLCHLYNAKLYIAVNTIITDNQTDEFIKTIKKYALLSPDAFIVQDIGAAYIIKNITDIPIHASTQMTIHSINGAKIAHELGFSRVVISREADRNLIRNISDTGIETEIFVHGALCMSVSGQCYMSSMIGSRSANRGLCAQSCRLPFSHRKNSNEHCLSLKDLCLANHIDKIIDCGVTSLKIEGRMKRPEYVAATVTAYRNAVDGKTPDIETLKAVFSRNGFTDGYFTAEKKNMFGMRDKDDVLSSASVIPKLSELYKKERKISELSFEISVKKDMPVSVTAYDSENNKTCITGNIPQTALNRSVSKELVEKQFSKLGDTIYNIGTISTTIDDGLSVSASELNALRRSAIKNICDMRTAVLTRPVIKDFVFTKEEKKHEKKERKIRIRVENTACLENSDLSGIEYIIIPMHCLGKNDLPQNIQKNAVIIEPPRFITDENKIISELAKLHDAGFTHLMCNNISYIRTGTDLGFTLHGDFGMNISNSVSIKNISGYNIDDITLSFELKLSQIKKISQDIPCGMIAYGNLPLMLTVNCPIKNSDGCRKCTHKITDRTNRDFYVRCCYDYTEIFNSDPVYLADKLDELPDVSFITLFFTNETPQQIKKITNEYISGADVTPSGITRGLYYRGIK